MMAGEGMTDRSVIGAGPQAARPTPRLGGAPDILVAIVSYRTGALVVAGLRGLAAEIAAYDGSVKVVVVENQSGDDSLAVIGNAIAAEGWSSWATLVNAPVNGGFSYGNNLAIRMGLASKQPPALFWLLNPDTCVQPGALQALVDFMQAHPRVGIAGGSYQDEAGIPWIAAFRFPGILGELENGIRFGPMSRLLNDHVVFRPMSDRDERVDWLPGASMMVRREVFDAVGLMDEGYFLYFEETDFCLAARRAGWDCWYVPASRVMHIAGQSTGVTGKETGVRRLPAYWFDSRRRYFVKNHGRLYAALADIVWVAGFSIWRARRWIQRKPDTDPPHMLKDMIRHSALFHSGLPDNSRLNQVGRATVGD